MPLKLKGHYFQCLIAYNVSQSVADPTVTHQQFHQLFHWIKWTCSVPKSVISRVISTINQIAECTSSCLKNEIFSSIKSSDVSDSGIKYVEVTIDGTDQPLDFLSSVHKQNSYFANHPVFLQPQSLSRISLWCLWSSECIGLSIYKLHFHQRW